MNKLVDPNKVYAYLGSIRRSCVLNIYENGLDRYTGRDELILQYKHFCIHFTHNLVFQPGNELHDVATQSIACKDQNLVKVFAERIFALIVDLEERYIDLARNSACIEFPSPNDNMIRDAVAVLSVLRRHFTYNRCNYFTNFDSESFTMSSTIDKPSTSWDFIDISLINDRLNMKENFPMKCSRICSYEFSENMMRRFFNWFNNSRISSKGTIIFSQNAIDGLIKQLKNNRKSVKVLDGKNKTLTLSFQFCCNDSNINYTCCKATLCFRRNSGNYYYLVIAKLESCVYEYIENKDPVCVKVIFCDNKHIKHFKKSQGYKEYALNVFDTEKVIIFE